MVVGKTEDFDENKSKTYDNFTISEIDCALHDCLISYYYDDKKDDGVCALKRKDNTE